MMMFVKVVEHKSFTAASVRLDVTPQAVSKRIQYLERWLNVRLINRTTRTVSLTEAGKIYFDHCVKVINEINENRELLSSYSGTLKGVLRFKVTPSLAGYIVPVIAKLTKGYPDLSIDMVVEQKEGDFISDEFDAAIRITPLPDSSLIVRKLASYNFIVCGSPDYLKAHQPLLKPADLRQHSCLIFMVPPLSFDAAPPWTYQWRFMRGDQEELVVTSGTIRSTSADALRLAAAHELGLFFTPDYAVAEYLQRGKLVRVLGDYRLPPFDIMAVYPHRAQLARKVRVFIDLLAEHFSTEAWRDVVVQSHSA